MHSNDAYLLISGIQHFAFCKRQWALIHIETQWQENLLTIEGLLMHNRSHEICTERHGDRLIARGMAVTSNALHVQGVCDVVEFIPDEQGVPLSGKYGSEGTRYMPVPVEYKRGKPKAHDADKLQLCAQGMCLEEMLVCDIPRGYLYYGETKHRFEVEFSPALRKQVTESFLEMRRYDERGYTPKVKTGTFCKS